MSENITHYASMEDCFHFMAISPDICEEFKSVGVRHDNLARLASVTRYGDSYTAPLMDRLRQRRRSGAFDEKQRQILVYVLGWLCHRAADRCMKPVFTSFDASTLRHAEAIDYSPSECSVYNDAFIYKRYYAEEANGLYPKAVFEELMESSPQHERFDVPGTRELVRVWMQNSLLAMHRVDEAGEDLEAWFDKIERRRQRFTLEVERYAEAIRSPVPEKYRRYIVEADFYDASEPILQLALQLRAAGKGTAEELAAALAAPPKSSYAHILHTGFRYLLAASEFFTGDMDVDTLKDHFDIGKLGRDGKPA